MIPFTKVHGLGNNFVLFEARRCPATIRDAAFIQRVCQRHTGVGADGVLIVSPGGEEGVDVQVDYHNADGSWETLCANGTRCVVAYAVRRWGLPSDLTVRTGAGDLRASLLPDGQVRLQIHAPRHVTEQVEIDGFQGRHVDSGAPHFAVEVKELDEGLVATHGPAIRRHEAFQPRGINVDFFQRLDSQTLRVITYEKGVEAVMLSCASGSTAACFQAASSGAMTSPVRVINPGGELTVEFDPSWQQVTITGAAALVFDAELPDDF